MKPNGDPGMAKNLTIWCISKYASPPEYGVGARLFYIAREFCGLGLDVVLISSDSNHLARYPATGNTFNVEKFGRLTHVWIKTYKYSRSASLKRIISWLDFEFKLFRLDRSEMDPPDVVIVSSLSLLTIVYGIFLKKHYGCKLVFEIRDIYPLTLTDELGVCKWNPVVLLLGWIEKTGYKNADLIVGTMPNLKEHVQEIIGSEKNVLYSPLGISEIWADHPEESSEIDSLFPQTGKFVVGYAGSLGVSNAMDAFFEAILRLSETKDICFIIVGEGDMKPRFMEQLAGKTNVRIGPRISQKEIPYFLSKCDLLYLSTHNSRVWKYGQSMNKIIDYMMASKPIVASYSGYQSMINEANAGIFVTTNDVDSIVKAITLFRDMPRDERNAYGSRGRKWVEENHSYKALALSFYNRIIDLF